ncbi:MAG TPA: hypothetical protein VL989_01480 [Candidatus Sulfotelmatobacter sp.]|nr:hypothetical protein [Candidatus Sulfotelmatobacter sp.]
MNSDSQQIVLTKAQSSFVKGVMSEFRKNGGAELLAELVALLQTIDENAPDAELNETTMSDNNGGRIELNQ